MHPAIDRFDAAVERAAETVRTPALDAVMYPVSSSADHSLLWFIVGTGLSVRRGDLRFATRFAAAMGLESAVTNGPVKALFRRTRPAPHAVEGSRVYVGMHHASDVIVGAGFGLAFGHALKRWVGTPKR
jgi:hypothetical protein